MHMRWIRLLQVSLFAIGLLACEATSDFEASQTVAAGVPLVADAYVRDGSYANTNYGKVANLRVKTASSNYNRWAYLRFDLGGVTGSVTLVKLRLFGRLDST